MTGRALPPGAGRPAPASDAILAPASDAILAPASDAILDRLLTLHPKAMDLSLGRLTRLLDRLGNPEQHLPPVVHIAGTNGKGSTLAMIRAGIETSGQSAHAYTSPHLARFHERIRLAGTLIEEPALAALLEECETANDGAPITFFEITTAAGLLAFSRTKAEWCLLEVGLGGRLDATNVVDAPAVTVITPVSIDHQQYLGDTLAEIAGEKAGILKPGVPGVIGLQEPEGLAAIEARARAIGAPLWVQGRDFDITRDETGALIYRDAAGSLPVSTPALPGAHQVENAALAIAALRRIGFEEAALARAPGAAMWPARIQRLETGTLAVRAAEAGAELWLDGGHNASAGLALARHFAGLPPRETHLVCGMLDTKDPEGFLRPFAGFVGRLHAVTVPDTEATIPPDRLIFHAGAVGLAAETASGPDEALTRALDQGAKRVVICGSLYLAGAVLREGAG